MKPKVSLNETHAGKTQHKWPLPLSGSASYTALPFTVSQPHQPAYFLSPDKPSSFYLGPLHWLLPLPGMLFLQNIAWLLLFTLVQFR